MMPDPTGTRIVAGSEMTLAQEVESLRGALVWALTQIEPPVDGAWRRSEWAEDYGGATRMAWPDEPENWD